jgi:hypothetical protein
MVGMQALSAVAARSVAGIRGRSKAGASSVKSPFQDVAFTRPAGVDPARTMLAFRSGWRLNGEVATSVRNDSPATLHFGAIAGCSLARRC